MTSALESHPKLRTDLKIVRREHQGRVHYVVKQPHEQKYYRFGELEVGLMRLMDGRRSPAEISEAAVEALGVRPPAGQVADFAQKLKRLGLVERTPVEQHLMLMERLRAQRNVRVRRRTKGSMLRLRFSIGDPDRLFDWAVERIRWMWSPGFVGGSVVLFAAYLIILSTNSGDFWEGVVGLYTLSGFTAWDWVLFWGLFLVIGPIHELGHGLTTKHFGGEVHEIGGMLLYFTPALYCNTNDAWTFEKRAHRLWVTFAGPWIQMIIAGLAAIAWVITEPGTFIHRLSFLAVLMGGITAVLANFNPLIPLDGYYALSDWLEVPNMRRRAFGYWGWLVKRWVLGIEVAEPAVTPRERIIFIVYGGLAFAYSFFVGIVSFVWLTLIFGRLIGPWIWVIVAFIAGRMIARISGRSSALTQAAATTWRAGFLRGGRGWITLGAVVLVIGLPFVLPWTLRARGEFRVEAAERAFLRAEVDGVLDRLHVSEGDTVRAGDRIAAFWNPEIEARLLDREARAEQLRLTRARAEAQGDRASAASAGAELEELLDELALLRLQRDRLAGIHAPIDGIVLGYRLQERVGEALKRGTLLLEIASLEGRYARVRLPLKEAGDVAPGQRANLKLSARPNLKFKSKVSAVAPASEEGWLEAQIPLPSGEWQPTPGMEGIAKIATQKVTVSEAIARVVRRTIRIDLWL